MAAAEFQLLIGGERVDGDDGAYEIVNPATEAVVGEAPEAAVAQVDGGRRRRRPTPSRRGAAPSPRSGPRC